MSIRSGPALRIVVVLPDGDMVKPEWILIANATRARLLQREPGCPLVVIDSFDHPLSRSKASDLADDRAGQGKTGHGFGGASYPLRVDAKEKAQPGTATARLVSATHDLDLTSVGLVELDQRVARESAHQGGPP